MLMVIYDALFPAVAGSIPDVKRDYSQRKYET